MLVTVRIPLFLALILSAFSLMACGGSTPPPPPTGNFSNASLKGQYAFVMNGTDTKGAYFARIGSFTADGSGALSAGLTDALNLSSGQPPSIISFASGTYSIDQNGRGQLVFQGASGASLQLNIAMQSPSNGFLIESDLAATGSGTFELQSASDFSVTALNSHYVFDLYGVTFIPNAVAPIAAIGEFNANGAGGITGGVMDTSNGNLSPSGATAISPATYQMDPTYGSTFGRGTLTVNSYTFAFYIVDSTHLVILEEDTLGGSSGDAVLQPQPAPTQNSQFTSSFVYMVRGSAVLNQKGPDIRVVRFISDGNGNLGSISLDDSNNGNYTHISGSSISNATYSLDASNPGSGRGTFTFTSSGLVFSDVFYLVSPTQGVVSEIPKGIIAEGPLSAQSSGPFALSSVTGNLIFNWSGTQLGANTAIPIQQDYVGQYALSNVSGNNISGLTDYVDFSLSGNQFFPDVNLGGMLTFNGDGTANNNYRFAVNGSPSVTINFQAYFVNSSTLYLVSSDSNRTIGGVIAMQ